MLLFGCQLCMSKPLNIKRKCLAPRLSEDVGYEGHVSENGGLVHVFPEIRAENGPICGFRIVNTDWGKIPFEVITQ